MGWKEAERSCISFEIREVKEEHVLPSQAKGGGSKVPGPRNFGLIVFSLNFVNIYWIVLGVYKLIITNISVIPKLGARLPSQNR